VKISAFQMPSFFTFFGKVHEAFVLPTLVFIYQQKRTGGSRPRPNCIILTFCQNLVHLRIS
jgi:hypothetical protein